MNLEQLSLSAALLEPDDISAPTTAWLGHIPFGAWLVHAMKPATLVELGTHFADSYFAFCKTVRTHGLNTRCYAVDTWAGDEHAGEYSDEVYGRVKQHHDKHYAAFSQMMRMRFDQALEHFSDGSVDLLHIDGLHTYEAVREDFTTWLPKLSDRAVVLFHDTAVREGDFGVWRYWEEIAGQYPNLNFSHSNGLGVLLVGKNQPEALRELVAAWADPARRHDLASLFAKLGDHVLLNWHYRRQTRELGARHDDIFKLEQAVFERNAHIDELRGVLAERESQISALQGELAGLHGTLNESQAEVARLTYEVQRQREENELMRQSVSWRITEPLRVLRSKVKG